MWPRRCDSGRLTVGAFPFSRAFTVFRNPSTALAIHLFFRGGLEFVTLTGLWLCWRKPTPSMLTVVVAEASGVGIGRCSCEETSMLLSVTFPWPVIEQILATDRHEPHRHFHFIWTLSKYVQHTHRWHTWWSKQCIQQRYNLLPLQTPYSSHVTHSFGGP